MAELEPNVVVVDGGDQNGGQTAAAGTHGVGENLVTGQGALFGGQAVLAQALPDALGEGLLCVGDAVDAVTLTEDPHRSLLELETTQSLMSDIFMS